MTTAKPYDPSKPAFKPKPTLPPTRVVVVLEGQYTAIPGDAVNVLVGPAELRVTYHPSGAISGLPQGGTYLKLAEAARAGLRRVAW